MNVNKSVNTVQMNQIRAQILEWVAEDEEKIVDLFSRLVQCETPSPPGDTRQAMKLVQAYLDEEALSYKNVDYSETMTNLLSSVQMHREGRHLMLNGHLDVLPAGNEPGWTDSPWSGKVEDGRVWGRGTSDMKAGVTALMFAYTYLNRLRYQLSGKLSLSLVSDEETGYGRGTGYMFEQIESEMDADCVLTTEPSGPEAICFSSKGYLHFAVRVTTRGSISGYPNESASAVRIAVDIIRDLDELEALPVQLPDALARLLADPEWCERHDELMGKGAAALQPLITVNVGTINGGTSASVISPDCAFSVSVVIPVGADPYPVLAKAQDIIARYPEAELIFEGIDTADVSAPDGELAMILQDTVESLGRVRPEFTPSIAISDCRYWRYRGIPAYWYGVDGPDCSAANESVPIEELLHVVRTSALAAAQYLLRDEPEVYEALVTAPQFRELAPELKSLPARRVARISQQLKSFGEIDAAAGPMFDALYMSLVVAGITVGSDSILTYEMANGGILVSAAFPVGSEVTSTSDFEVVDLPVVDTVAAVIHRGDPAQADDTWKGLRRWAKAQGFRMKEQYREVYIVGAPNPVNLWATEMYQTVKQR